MPKIESTKLVMEGAVYGLLIYAAKRFLASVADVVELVDTHA